MSDIALPLFAETISQALVDADGSARTLPDAKLGDTWVCSLRFLESTSGDPIEKQLNVVGIRAAIGPVLAPPTDGKFKLNVIGNNTAAISYGATADELLAALGEGVGISCSKPAPGCWIVRLTDDGEEAAGLEPAEIRSRNTTRSFRSPSCAFVPTRKTACGITRSGSFRRPTPSPTARRILCPTRRE